MVKSSILYLMPENKEFSKKQRLKEPVFCSEGRENTFFTKLILAGKKKMWYKESDKIRQNMSVNVKILVCIAQITAMRTDAQERSRDRREIAYRRVSC